MALKLVSVNIERDKHLVRVEKFIYEQQPDVLCLQELYQHSIPLVEKWMPGGWAYAPLTHFSHEYPEPRITGNAIFTRKARLQRVEKHYYKGSGNPLPFYETTLSRQTGKPVPNTATTHHSLLVATVEDLRIGTTHLTWTEDGQATPEQLDDVENLLTFARAEAEQSGGLFMCGDFNAPRGRASFARLAENFIDSIPVHYTTSIDTNLHRVGKNMPPNRMVDGLFHTSTYKAENVQLHTGVSDHCAITAILSKA